MNIQGKIAWITGASSGIGAALALELVNEGATVVLSARDAGKLTKVKETIDARSPGRCHIIPCDVSRPSEIAAAAAEIRKRVPRLDILVNNAGVSQRSYASDTAIEVDRAIMEVNFFGAVGITKAVLPWMIENGGGHIVVISSMAGKYGFRMRSAYAASKHALQGFFETLRAELHGKNIQVTIISPGRVRTDISINSLTGSGEKYGIMDKGQERGVPVQKCVRIISRAIKHNRKEVYIGVPELFLLIIKRIIPPLFYQIVNKASPT